jgi:hypothetical protein
MSSSYHVPLWFILLMEAYTIKDSTLSSSAFVLDFKSLV